MNICLIGYGIPCLILANVLINKNIKISIFDEYKSKNKFNTRTLGITKDNIDFLKQEKINIEKNAWPINNIKIFNDLYNNKEILNFGPVDNQLFSIIKYSQFINLLKKNKLIKFIKKNKKTFYNSIINNKNEFDLIINFNENNNISKEIFFRRHYKNYRSLAYTTLINHKKCDNKFAYQIFTKLGPIAFLPCSNKETSVVFSIFKQKKNILENEILELIKKYNKKYLIKSFSKIEKFDLKGSLLKNYYYKNILCFGDNIHKIHPLAGQGLNMTIRDIKVLSELIDKKIDLGLPLDQSILEEFENKTKHYNYLYANGINFIHEFFKLDNKYNNNFSNKIFYFLENNFLFKKYSIKFANNGLFNY
jgi:2-octaprenyl-6-methoxyphenol hydroxylase